MTTEASRSSRRLEVLAGHLCPEVRVRLRPCSSDSSRSEPPEDCPTTTHSVIPKKRQELLKWNGWGYEGTELTLENGILNFHGGERYSVREIDMSDQFKDWVRKVFNLKMEDGAFKYQANKMPTKYPPSIVNQEFCQWITECGIQHSFDGEDRLFRAHGQTLEEIALLRGIWTHGTEANGDSPGVPFERIPDLVVWPTRHADVVRIVTAAHEMNVVLIPFGGGTNVTKAVICPPDEQRMIISVDTSQMNRILWIDQKSFLVCAESGIVGQDLERELNSKGFTTGHEPDSYEFSSLGGWVATRASGMKKNKYGNIEDLLVHVKMVTPKGVLQKECKAPRISSGPDLHHVIMGSEGTLGIVTEVVLKIRPLPECREYASIIFPNLERGINFMWDVARERCQPASLRLIDNEQYKSGQFLKERVGLFGSILDSAKMAYLRRVKGIDTDEMSIAIVIFEGSQEETRLQQKKVYDIALHKFGGILGGSTNGQRGYRLTFAIAYVRDFMLSHGVFGDSFETSVPWEKTLTLCQNVKYRVAQEFKARGFNYFLVSCRVTQVYDCGACVYFYMAVNGRELVNNQRPGHPMINPFEVFHEVEDKAREEILASGGSISHHHGIGKIRRQWYPAQVSKPGFEVYQAVKQQLDPNNIFGVQNIAQLPVSHSCQKNHSFDTINQILNFEKN
ncbi:alkyldihydroxyacetonephosphate synthase, peroxisomal-like [Ischnura elegans]|uniref:alkyldihydroxyacetonephosphate synthase, peroxisomal-like n=1 Tax=Ischnura elegans TaxID=197161 RepID=UPI001ED8A721|nr:alkyldihydroxyacetonephosphate synthase, peroxisomal-like [Ischnura elegans]